MTESLESKKSFYPILALNKMAAWPAWMPSVVVENHIYKFSDTPPTERWRLLPCPRNPGKPLWPQWTEGSRSDTTWFPRSGQTRSCSFCRFLLGAFSPMREVLLPRGHHMEGVWRDHVESEGEAWGAPAVPAQPGIRCQSEEAWETTPASDHIRGPQWELPSWVTPTFMNKVTYCFEPPFWGGSSNWNTIYVEVKFQLFQWPLWLSTLGFFFFFSAWAPQADFDFDSLTVLLSCPDSRKGKHLNSGLFLQHHDFSGLHKGRKEQMHNRSAMKLPGTYALCGLWGHTE